MSHRTALVHKTPSFECSTLKESNRVPRQREKSHFKLVFSDVVPSEQSQWSQRTCDLSNWACFLYFFGSLTRDIYQDPIGVNGGFGAVQDEFTFPGDQLGFISSIARDKQANMNVKSKKREREREKDRERH